MTVKTSIWIVTTCVPAEPGAEPCLPAPFPNEQDAEAYADKMLRAEWQNCGPRDEETDEVLPYPDDWRKAQEAILANVGPTWGTWQITSHGIEIETKAGNFRDCLPSPRALAFEYYEVRPCIERKGNGDAGEVVSYRSKAEFAVALEAADACGNPYESFWTLYGMSCGEARAIGDFVSEAAAFETMNAILAVPAAAMHRIREGRPSPAAGAPGGFISAAERAACDIEDMILQSSDAERI